MDGSINLDQSVKWRKKSSSGGGGVVGVGGSNKSQTSSSQSSSSQVVNGTNGSHDDSPSVAPSIHGNKLTDGHFGTKTSTTNCKPVNGATEPPSPKRILQLKKQLEKEERIKNQHTNQWAINQINGHIVNGGSNGQVRLASLHEEEELTSLELQQHFQVDQYPCTVSSNSKLNPYSSANTTKRMSKNGNHTDSSTGNANETTAANCGHEHRITWKTQLFLYLNSLRPRTFTPSLASVTLGAVLAFKATGNFDLLIFIVSCLTVLAVHGAGNLVNTYYDFVKGVDRSTQSVNQCPDRTLVDHRLSIDQVVHLGVIAYMFGCFGFVCLVFLSPARMEHLALVYFCGISCSFLYTGGLGLKYIGLGDILIMVIFGPISILFSFMSQSGYIDPATIAFALPLAFHTEAILHSNNTRDIESDQRAGAVTLAILIGPTFCHIIYALLLFIPYIMLIVSIIHYSIVFCIPLITITKAFQLEKNFRSGHLSDIPTATASLHLIFSISYIVSCCLIHPSNIPLLHVIN